ncbi:MAG: hypothetical protein SNG79_01425 [Rikenellaceae bacterium]
MNKITVVDNQTVLDIAMQYYGTPEAVGEILTNNPDIENDEQSLIDLGRDLDDFHPDIKLSVGSQIYIDDDSLTMIKTTVKKITDDVTTYMTQEWQERLIQ